jgi:acyl-CoA synthetase (AMP-forming)/AMP-acid ligase II
LGEQGELVIGGFGVARGYLNRPDLTAEKFVPDPFGPDPRRRMYCGDLKTSWTETSVRRAIGSQVKIHGYRIELRNRGALRRHRGVRDAVVQARGCVRRQAAGRLRGPDPGPSTVVGKQALYILPDGSPVAI